MPEVHISAKFCFFKKQVVAVFIGHAVVEEMCKRCFALACKGPDPHAESLLL